MSMSIHDKNEMGDENELGHDKSPEDIRAGFAEACNLARHYSTLRFVMFSVFVTIIGALIAVEFDPGRRPVSGRPLICFRVASLFLVFCFAVSEWRIADLVKFYQKTTYEFGSIHQHPKLFVAKPPKQGAWQILAPLLTSTPFVLAAIMWLIALFFFRGAPLWLTPIQP